GLVGGVLARRERSARGDPHGRPPSRLRAGAQTGRGRDTRRSGAARRPVDTGGAGRGRLWSMSSPDVERLVEEWLALAEAGERLGIPLGKVKQLVRDGELLAVPRGERGAPHVPAATLVDGEIVRGLAGTLTLLRDA